MEATSVFLNSRINPFGFSVANTFKPSIRPFNKHLQVQLHVNNSNLKTIKPPSKCFFRACPLSSSPEIRRTHLLCPPKCSYSNSTSSESHNPFLKPLKNLSFDSLKATLSQLTPIDICKWSGILCVSIAATKRTVNLLLNPFFWMYFSWTWLFWPWFLAVGVAVYGLYCLRRHLCGEANVFEQIAIVTSVFTWLTLVPPAHFNGFLEGWPFGQSCTSFQVFGPYRWVRHPIYASTMLLFVSYCLALRAPISSLFVIAVCLMYYEQKVKLEEASMVETFGEKYMEYANKVKYKFIPFVY
ncbi:unnamed protein product, partial [Vitis vinifera]